MARLALIVYPEPWKDNEEKPIEMQMMATQPLSFKIYDLLNWYLLKQLGRSKFLVGKGPDTSEKAIARFEAKRKKVAKES